MRRVNDTEYRAEPACCEGADRPDLAPKLTPLSGDALGCSTAVTPGTSPEASVTDSRLGVLLRSLEPRSTWKAGVEREVGRVSRISGVDEVLGDAALRFLGDVLSHSDEPLRVRYASGRRKERFSGVRAKGGREGDLSDS